MLTDDELAAVERAIDVMARFCFPEPGNAAQARIDTLRALAARARNAGWLPIESAPEDGPYLVFGGHMNSDLNFGAPDKEVSGVVKVEWRANTNFQVADTCYYSVWVESPTHWMPLPEPPKGGE